MAPHPKAVMFMRFAISYSTIVLLWYDYALTWTREVKYFWTRRFTLSTATYIMCRYGLVANILYTLALANKLPTMRVCFLTTRNGFPTIQIMSFIIHCDAGYRICAILSVIGRVGIVTVWGSRTYAVYNRNKVILVLFVAFGLTVVGVAVMHVPYVSCTGRKGKVPAPDLLSIVTAAYEILSALFTTARTVQTVRVGGPWWVQRKSLTFLILREGLLYFGFVTSFSILCLVSQLQSPPGTFLPRFMNAYTMPLSGQMTARFLIHLREWDDRMSNPETNRWKARTEGGGTNGQIRFKESSIPSTLSLNLTAVLGDDPLLRPLEASEVGRGGDISEEREVGSEGEA